MFLFVYEFQRVPLFHVKNFLTSNPHLGKKRLFVEAVKKVYSIYSLLDLTKGFGQVRGN